MHVRGLQAAEGRGVSARRGDHGDSWRYDVSRMPLPPRTSITVLDCSDEAKAERESRIRDGAEVVPFGFARAIPTPVRPTVEPQLWDGDDS